MTETGKDAERRETISEVVATMRQRTKLRGFWRSCDLNEILAYHADRIEAAWRRERESLMLGPRSWEECIERYKKAREIHDDLY